MKEIKHGHNYHPGKDTTIRCPNCGYLNHYSLEELLKQTKDKPDWYTDLDWDIDLNKNKGKHKNTCFECGKELTLYIKAE